MMMISCEDGMMAAASAVQFSVAYFSVSFKNFTRLL